MHKIDVDGPITPEVLEEILIASQYNKEIVLSNFMPTSVVAFMKVFLSGMLTITIPEMPSVNNVSNKIQKNSKVITDNGEEKIIESIRKTPDGKYYLVSLVSENSLQADNTLPVV